MTPSVNWIRTSLANLIAQYVSVFVVIVQGFVMVPLYLARIPIELYGAWLALGNILFLLQISDPGVSLVIQQRIAFFYGKRDGDSLSMIIGTGLVIGIVISAIPLLSLPFLDLIISCLSLSGGHADAIHQCLTISVFTTSVILTNYNLSAVLLGLQLTKVNGIIVNISSIIGLIATFVFLLYDYGVHSIPMGLAVRAFCWFVGCVICLGRWIISSEIVSIRVATRFFKSLLQLSGFTLFYRLSSMVTSSTEGILIAHAMSPSFTTIFMLTQRAFYPLKMFSNRTAAAFTPSITHLIGSDDREKMTMVIVKTSRLLLIGSAVIASFVVALNDSFMTIWVGRDNFAGQSINLLIAFSLVLTTSMAAIAQFIFAIGEIKRLAIVGFSEAFFRVVLQYVLADYIGMAGVPLGGIISVCIFSFWYFPHLLSRNLTGDFLFYFKLFLKRICSLIVLIVLGHGIYSFIAVLDLRLNWSGLTLAGILVIATIIAMGSILERQARNDFLNLVWKIIVLIKAQVAK